MIVELARLPHAVNLALYFGLLVPAAISALAAHWHASRPGGRYERWAAPDPATRVHLPAPTPDNPDTIEI